MFRLAGEMRGLAPSTDEPAFSARFPRPIGEESVARQQIDQRRPAKPPPTSHKNSRRVRPQGVEFELKRRIGFIVNPDRQIR